MLEERGAIFEGLINDRAVHIERGDLLLWGAALGLALITPTETAGILWPVDEPVLIIVYAIPAACRRRRVRLVIIETVCAAAVLSVDQSVIVIIKPVPTGAQRDPGVGLTAPSGEAAAGVCEVDKTIAVVVLSVSADWRWIISALTR